MYVTKTHQVINLSPTLFFNANDCIDDLKLVQNPCYWQIAMFVLVRQTRNQL